MLHPHTELRFISDVIGHGVLATRPIPRGTITWVRDKFDLTFAPAAFAELRPPYRQVVDKYTFVDRHGDAVLCWDFARYVNHSCRATCLSAGYDFELAVRDIAVGEELTDDYGTLNPSEPFPCACGAPDCRKQILPDDFLRYADRWDDAVGGAFGAIRALEQPLWPLVEEQPDFRAIDAAVAGREPVASCRANRYVRSNPGR